MMADSVFYEFFNEIYNAKPEETDKIFEGRVNSTEPLQIAIGNLVLPDFKINSALTGLEAGDRVLILADGGFENFYVICGLR